MSDPDPDRDPADRDPEQSDRDPEQSDRDPEQSDRDPDATNESDEDFASDVVSLVSSHVRDEYGCITLLFKHLHRFMVHLQVMR